MGARMKVEGGTWKTRGGRSDFSHYTFILINVIVIGLLGLGLLISLMRSLHSYGALYSASLTPSPITPSATASPTATLTPTSTSTPTPTFTPTPTQTRTPTLIPSLTPRSPLPTAALLNNDWQRLPILPEVSPAMKAVYLRGLALGNDPRAFAKVGDCNTEDEFFLTPFDQPGEYRLGPYADLQAVIDNFGGSFSRASAAARTGFGPSAMFDSLWVNPNTCFSTEGPLECEYRLHRPSLALIGLGTHYHPMSKFESQMRAVIEFSLDHGVVPILATKVDMEGGDRVNALIAYLAQQYEVPLWNFWLAAQPLYNQGQPDGIHFTWSSNHFDSEYSMGHGWPVRNLTALQALDTVWRAVAE